MHDIKAVNLKEKRGYKYVYEKFDLKPNYNAANIDNVIKALETGDDDLLEKSMGNSLQGVACELVPEIKSIIDMLKSKGLKMVMMTGSGSAVFALSQDKKLMKKLFKEIETECPNYYVELTEVLK